MFDFSISDSVIALTNSDALYLKQIVSKEAFKMKTNSDCLLFTIGFFGAG